MKKLIFTITLLWFGLAITLGQNNSNTNPETSQKKQDFKESIHVKFKDGAKPIVFVDGEKFDFPLDLIDPDKIESVFVVKGKEAIEKYNAPNGVVIIKTKKGNASQKNPMKLTDQGVSEIFSNKKPLIIIDGKITKEDALKKLNPKKIDKIEVIKGEAAKEKYNSINGVVLITTKKE